MFKNIGFPNLAMEYEHFCNCTGHMWALCACKIALTVCSIHLAGSEDTRPKKVLIIVTFKNMKLLLQPK